MCHVMNNWLVCTSYYRWAHPVRHGRCLIFRIFLLWEDISVNPLLTHRSSFACGCLLLWMNWLADSKMIMFGAGIICNKMFVWGGGGVVSYKVLAVAPGLLLWNSFSYCDSATQPETGREIRITFCRTYGIVVVELTK
jgi:hypothetical protein